MRTVAFAAQDGSLEVCARKVDYEAPGRDNGTVTKEGLHDDIVVPLGLMAALRRQMKMEKRLKGSCWDD